MGVLDQERMAKIKQYLKWNPRGMTISDVSSKMHMNRNLVAKYLDMLLISGQVDMQEIGAAKVYFLSHRVPVSALLDFSSDMVIVLDKRNRILKTNEPMLTVLNEDRDSIVGTCMDNSQNPFLIALKSHLPPPDPQDTSDWITEMRCTLQEKECHFRVKWIPTVFEDGGQGTTLIIKSIPDQFASQERPKVSGGGCQGIIEDQADSIVQFISDDTTTPVNAACARHLEEGVEHVIEKPCIPGTHDEGTRISLLQKPIVKMDYLPEEPPDVSEFIDRTEVLASLQKSLNKNVIVIQGLAGIGKTHLAAKLYNLIERDYVTCWKVIHDFDTFDTLTRDIAGFLNSHGNAQLAEYLNQGNREREQIVKIILEGLDNKKYVLFFDNYHVVDDPEIHMLFERLKRDLKGSSIVVVSRTSPFFIGTGDRIKNIVTQEELDGFDLSATKEFFALRGLNLDEQQLRIVHSRVNGHPMLLLMVSNLVNLEEFEDIVGENPEAKIDQYLYDEIFRRLSDREQDVLKAMSVFRRPFTADMCVHVCSTENVKDTIRSLEEKLLVKRKGNYYYLHDLIKDFSYAQIDNPGTYHWGAYNVLAADTEPVAEIILETVYHYLKVHKSLDEEILQYFSRCPSHPLNDLTILELLLEHNITSPMFFEVVRKRSAQSNSEIKNLALQVAAIKRDIDVDAALVLFENEFERRSRNAIQRENNVSIISNLHYFIQDSPERVLSIIDRIEKNATNEELFTLVWLFKDDRFKSHIAERVLKRFITSQEEQISTMSRNVAANILRNWGMLEGLDIKDHLSILRAMDSGSALQYLEDLLSGESQFNRFNINNSFYLAVLEEIYTLRPQETCDTIIRMIARTYGIIDIAIPSSAIFFNQSGLNTKETIRELVRHSSFNVRVAGFFSLLQSTVLLDYFKTKYGIIDDRYDALNDEVKSEALQLLETITRDDDTLLGTCAHVLKNELTTPSEPEKRTRMNVVSGSVAKGAMRFIKPDLMSGYLSSVESGDDDKSFLMFSTIGMLSLTNVHTKDLFSILSAGNSDNEATRLMVSFFCDKIRSAPEELLPLIKKFGFESKWQIQRYGAILWASIPLITVPESTIKVLNEALRTPAFDDPDLKTAMLSSLAFLKKWMLLIGQYKSQRSTEIQSILSMIDDLNQNLLHDKDEVVRVTADLHMNGIRVIE